MRPSLQAAESLRVEAVDGKLVEKLEAYRQANSGYPDSLLTLSFTNSPQEIQMMPYIQKMNY